MYVFPCRKMHLFPNGKSQPEFFPHHTIERSITCTSSCDTFSLLSFNWLVSSVMFVSRESTRSWAALRCAFCSCTCSCKFSWACLWLSDWFFSFSVSWVTCSGKKKNVRRLEQHVQGNKNLILLCLMALETQCYHISHPELLRVKLYCTQHQSLHRLPAANRSKRELSIWP